MRTPPYVVVVSWSPTQSTGSASWACCVADPRQLVDALGELRPPRLVFVHEIDVGTRKRLGCNAVDPGREIGIAILGSPQTYVAAIRSCNKRRVALVGVGDA